MYPHELRAACTSAFVSRRALIHNPGYLLMDEPFGALDALTRDQFVLDLHSMVSERWMTVVFVTHSVAEAVFLSDRMISS